MPTELHVPYQTDTAADRLLAIGVAEFATSALHALGRPTVPITLRDDGDRLTILLPSALNLADLEQFTQPFAIGSVRQLMTSKNAEKLDPVAPVFDYVAQRAERDVFTKHPKEDRERALREGEIHQPHPELPYYVAINQFKIADTYNKLIAHWSQSDASQTQAHLRFLLEAFSPGGDLAIAEQHWKETLKTAESALTETQLQIVNPISGKGGNTPKATAGRDGNLDGNWFLELLKFAGYFTIAIPLLFKSKDRKTYILRPSHAHQEMLGEIMRDFRAAIYPTTSVKTDILAVLFFVRTFVDYCRRAITAGTTDPLLALFGKMPRVIDLAQGFDVVTYMDMGSAFATMNMATINFPDWLSPITDSAGADAVQAILDEYIKVMHSLRTSKGDEGAEEFTLLHRFREFISGREVADFFDFAAYYGDYVLGRRHRNQYVAQLSTQGMETLVEQADKKLGPILANEGFLAIARAIRHATVLGQFISSKDHAYPYEVRYGLGQDLLRTAAYPDTFIAALSTFVQAYSAENARIAERVQKKSLNARQRPHIRTQDIASIVALVDTYGSETICKLLVAYGYATESRGKDTTIEGSGPEVEELDENMPADEE